MPDQSVVTYVGDLDMSVKPGSSALFCWGLRWAVPGKLAWEMCVDTNAQFTQLDVWNGTNHVPSALGSMCPIYRPVGLCRLPRLLVDSRVRAMPRRTASTR